MGTYKSQSKYIAATIIILLIFSTAGADSNRNNNDNNNATVNNQTDYEIISEGIQDNPSLYNLNFSDNDDIFPDYRNESLSDQNQSSAYETENNENATFYRDIYSENDRTTRDIVAELSNEELSPYKSSTNIRLSGIYSEYLTDSVISAGINRIDNTDLSHITGKSELAKPQGKLSTNLLGLTDRSFLPSAENEYSLIAGMVANDQLILCNDIDSYDTVDSSEYSEDLAYVYIYLYPEYSTSEIDPYTYEVKNRDDNSHYATAYVRVKDLLSLASSESVRFICEVIPPVANMGTVESEGDEIFRTKELRQLTGYTGEGFKVGIISDGVNHIADSIASGDLPENVHVLRDEYVGDEGTAMLEIVYDMAPGAELYFHDCGSNSIEFNEAIDELVSAGCNIICDDISWITQPFFEDGSIALHVEKVLEDNDILYISSAGNYAHRHYQGSYYDQGDGFHDFSSGTSDHKSLYQVIPAGSSIRIVLEWNDDFSGSSNDYDLYLYNYETGDLLTKSESTQSGSQEPLEFLYYANTGSSALDTKVLVNKFSGSSKILELYIYGLAYSNNIVASDSVYGHPAVKDAIAVGAIAASDPDNDDIEYFSSRGPVSIYYPSYEKRDKPDIAGIDGVSVTGVGGFGSPFYGTSASAPGVAGLLALIMDACPASTPDEIRAALYSSAEDLGDPGFDFDFGYGRADAIKLFDSLKVLPEADFSANITKGNPPLSILFTDNSTGNPTEWNWDFGDGNLSTVQNPVHIYDIAGLYSVNLTVSGETGSDYLLKTHYINVTLPAPELRSVIITPSETAIETGMTEQFTATGYDQYENEMTDLSFVWSLDNESIGTIDQSGLFTGINAGNTSIFADSGGIKGSAEVTVEQGFPDAVIIMPEIEEYADYSGFIAVMASNISEAKSISGGVSWNHRVISVSYLRANLTEFPDTSISVNLSDGYAGFELTSNGKITSESPKPLIDVIFTAKGSVGDNTTLRFTNTTWNRDSKSRELNCINGSFEIIEWIKGDFNGNKRVDIGDASKVAYMIIGKAETDIRADFNENGDVDIGDLSKITYYVAGKIKSI